MELKRLKQLWKESGFRPVKRMGQNFLIDKNVRDNIIRSVDISPDRTIVEIGSGFGMMSFSIAEKCGKLLAIEKDDKICSIIEPLFKEKGNIFLIHSSVLNVEFSDLVKNEGRMIIFGNIPYYISTPIIEKIIRERQCIESAYIVMQEDLADRIVSPPGSKIYGSLSCFVQFYTRPEKLFRIKKNSFYPVPQVGSCLLKIDLLTEPSVKVKKEELMFKIIRKAFSQRRKKMINPLSSKDFLDIDRTQWEGLLKNCNIDTSSRAEMVSLKEYARLSDAVSSISK